MVGDGEERREAIRVEVGGIARKLRCRILPGQEARLVDVSACGMRVETPRPLAPGRAVFLQVSEPKVGGYTVQGRVIRCAIVALSAQGGPLFHAGIAVPGSHGFLRSFAIGGSQQPRAE